MRAKLGLLALMAALAPSGATSVGQDSKPVPDITGLYELKDDQGTVVGFMTISAQRGRHFLAGSAVRDGKEKREWDAHGVLEGERGWYAWTFADGGTGRTEFVREQDGTLKGNVKGSVNGRDMEWKVTARRVPATCEVVLDPAKKIRMEFVLIKAGKFSMGSSKYEDDEKPVREVTISKDYWMQVTETTQAQWESVMGKNPSFSKGADLPVESVSWEDCQEFLVKLNGRARDQMNGMTAALPTEAQWEYVARMTWPMDENAWLDDNAGGKTQPVGTRKIGAWGVYDIFGNVWEWCHDWYGEYKANATVDPTGAASGTERCLRGGCAANVYAHSADRHKLKPDDRSSGIGLRVVLR